jgi:hypothetical protein
VVFLSVVLVDKLLSGFELDIGLNREGEDLIYALVGFAIMFGVLVGIGINQPRGTSVKTWCYGYLAIALIFDTLVIVGLIYQYASLIHLLLGLSAGAATGLAIHVAHHITEEDEHGHNGEGTEKKSSIFGF